jgi:Ca2+-binding EF-hand superfamily protein
MAVAENPMDTFKHDLTDPDGNPYEPEIMSEDQVRSMHGALDRNQDGKVTLSEVLAFGKEIKKEIAERDVVKIMDDIDANKDGKLTLDELLEDLRTWSAAEEEDASVAKEQRSQEIVKFRAADMNKDGTVDIHEAAHLFYPETSEHVLPVAAKAALDAKDSNHDGELSREEFFQGELLEGEQGSPPLTEAEKKDFDKLDVNQDDKLSLQEFLPWESGAFHIHQSMQALFALADVNRDSDLTLQELQNVRVKITGHDAHYHFMEWTEHMEL